MAEPARSTPAQHHGDHGSRRDRAGQDGDTHSHDERTQQRVPKALEHVHIRSSVLRIGCSAVSHDRDPPAAGGGGGPPPLFGAPRTDRERTPLDPTHAKKPYALLRSQKKKIYSADLSDASQPTLAP